MPQVTMVAAATTALPVPPDALEEAAMQWLWPETDVSEHTATVTTTEATSPFNVGMAAFNAPPGSTRGDDSDFDSDFDDADSTIGDAMPGALAPTRARCGSRCRGGAAKFKKPIAKKAKTGCTSERAKDIQLNRNKHSFDVSKLKNPKINPPVRIIGSTMRKITDPGRIVSYYDSESQRRRILDKIFKKHTTKDISNPLQTDAELIGAHCKVLAIRDGAPIGTNGDSSAMKYSAYVSKFVFLGGFALKSEFTMSKELRAKGIANKIGRAIVEANPLLKKSADGYAKIHMAGFRFYCDLLEKEKAGTINAAPPSAEQGEEVAEVAVEWEY